MNTTIYNSLSSDLKSQITTTRFYYKINATNSALYNIGVNSIYNYERSGTVMYTGTSDCNVALLNISDYLYASQSSNCSRTSNCSTNSSAYQNNWIGKMIYSSIGSGNQAWSISNTGYYNSSGYVSTIITFVANSNSVSGFSEPCANSSYYIFPVFYLKNQGYASKGTGTSSNPFYFSL